MTPSYPAESEVEPQVLSIADAATILGISRRAAYQMVEADRFPVRVLRVGSLLKVSKIVLEDFIAGRERA